VTVIQDWSAYISVRVAAAPPGPEPCRVLANLPLRPHEQTFSPLEFGSPYSDAGEDDKPTRPGQWKQDYARYDDDQPDDGNADPPGHPTAGEPAEPGACPSDGPELPA